MHDLKSVVFATFLKKAKSTIECLEGNVPLSKKNTNTNDKSIKMGKHKAYADYKFQAPADGD